MTDCQFYILTENLEIHKIGNRSWLIEEWQQALLLGEGALLVIDEIQKVRNWSETLKSTASCVAGFQCAANPERCD